MQHNELHLPRIVVLVLLAVGLGLAILQFDTTRRTELVSAANAASTTNASAGRPAPQQAAADGDAQLVAEQPAPEQPATELPVTETTPPPTTTVPTPTVRRRSGVVCSEPHRTVQVARNARIHAQPGGRAIATLPATSVYLGQSMTAWIQAVSPDGRWGRVSVPWTKPVGRSGWIRLDGLAGRTTTTMVVADLSERRVHVYRGCRELFSVRSAIGRPGSPSPKGRFWVTDRVPVPAAQQGSFGTYAFGLSTVQPNLPAGWTGGDQMAIHGTGAPGSIGEAASAGCLRVGEDALDRLRPLLRSGTPVIIQA